MRQTVGHLTTVLCAIAFFACLGIAKAAPPVFNGDVVTKTLPTYNVLAYGVKGDGVTDDTTAIQAALTAAGSTCGAVLFPVRLYYTTGTLTVPQCVTVEGATSGPFDFAAGSTPGTVAYAATFLVTSGSGNASGTPFITMNGNDTVENLAFYYPNQVPITSATPTAYPWTIGFALAQSQGNIVRRNTFINAYQAIRTHAGQSHVEHNMIGAFSQAILVDGSADTTWIQDNHITPVWDLIFNGGAAPGSNIDTWVQANQIAMQFLRADSNVLTGNVIFTGNIGIDIGSPGSSHIDSWGNAAANYLEDQNIGIRANTSGNVGWLFSNTYIESFQTYSVQTNTPAAGDSAPLIALVGGGMQGFNSANPTPNVNAGTVNTVSVSGLAPSNLQEAVFPLSTLTTAPTNSMVVGVDGNGIGTFRAQNGNGFQWENASGSTTYFSASAGGLSIPPAGTATGGGNFGSLGSNSLSGSIWNGSAAVTHTWANSMTSTGSDIWNYDGTRYFTITNAGAVTFNNNTGFTVGSLALLFGKGQISCSLSASTSCTVTATVQTGSYCTTSYDSTTAITTTNLLPAIVTEPGGGTTLTLKAQASTSSTGSVVMDYTCL